MDYQRAKKWIDLGEWGKGMDEFKLPSSDELVGKELKLRLIDGNQIVKCIFHDGKALAWGPYESLEKRPLRTERYEAIRIAPHTYFIDFIKNGKPNTSISMALDLNNGRATILTAMIPGIKKIKHSFWGRLGQGVDLSSIKVEVQHAIVNPSSYEELVIPHERTSDLIGKRIKYTYSRDRVYEHIYLNEQFYTWHCLMGAEAGLADTEFCDYFKIAPDIYLFSWREKIMPTFGLVMINLKDMRSNGKTFGLDISSGEYINFTMGSLAELINETKY
jgi:hypothetical protein